MDLRDVPRGRGFLTAVRRRGRPALVLATRSGRAAALALRFRQARVGSALAFLRDAFLIVRGLLRRAWRSPGSRRTLWLRRLALAWHASGAATELADAALAGESTAGLASRIAHIARELSGAEAAAVFGRGPSGPVLFGQDGGVPAADLAARTLQTNSPERRSEGVSRAVSIPLRMSNAVVGALVLRFAPDKPVALKPLEPLLLRAGAVLAAAEREARKDRFLSLAAHELKTPLTSIKGFAYSLSRRMEKGEKADPAAVEILERQAERLHGLLEEMLEVSRLEMQRFVLHQEPCEMGELVESALRSVRRLGAREEILVEGEDRLPLNADRERIERTIGALVLRARSLGSPLSLRFLRDQSYAELRVSWVGARLSIQELAQAFEPRWEEPQSARQGLGMALFIARHSVALHGGELRADPDALVLRLPLHAQPAEKKAAGAGRVLVVDDDEAIAKMLAEYLSEHDVAADWAGSGRAALDKIQRGPPPDALVLDLRMPDIDGRQVVEQIRRQGLNPRVVLLSADREVAAAARELRADGFVEKPFAPENLLAAVRRSLRAGGD
ncbi:MAG TPA: response regulator [Myxococcales bacterium]|nr:response regulator [Myxococcales bacterium]